MVQDNALKTVQVLNGTSNQLNMFPWELYTYSKEFYESGFNNLSTFEEIWITEAHLLYVNM